MQLAEEGRDRKEEVEFFSLVFFTSLSYSLLRQADRQEKGQHVYNPAECLLFQLWWLMGVRLGKGWGGALERFVRSGKMWMGIFTRQIS